MAYEYSNEELLEILEELDSSDDPFTQWEIDFISSLCDTPVQFWTQRQKEKLLELEQEHRA